MADSGPTATHTTARTKRLLAGVALLLFLGLVAGAAAADGVGGALLMVGLGVVLVGGAALVRGRARWAHVGSRRIGLIVALGGLGLFLVGGALVPTQSTPAASRLALGGTAATPPPSTQAGSLLTTTQPAPATPATPPTTSVPPVTTSAPAPTTPAPLLVTTTPVPPPQRTYAPAPRTQQSAPPAVVVPSAVAAPPPTYPVTSGSLGTAPIQKPPSGNFYRAGEYCPAVDAGKTTQDASGRSLICTNNNGLRWEYA